MYDNQKMVFAMCYDFDKTLSPKDMQEYALFPKLGVKAKKFWKDSNQNAKKEKMDKILSYMELIIRNINAKNNKLAIKRNDFHELGKDVELFPGVENWFERINSFAEENNVIIEHYIISAGLKEIIEGTSIAKYFTAIYASCFLYNSYDVPIWPKQVVNYTQKTQYLFRISKDCLDLGDEEEVNSEISNEYRRVPFRNIIYIGDSDTDIPAMKVVKNQGGVSIGVYNPYSKRIDKVCGLVRDDRINYFAPADYSENSILEQYVKHQILASKTSNDLLLINKEQQRLVRYIDSVDDIIHSYIMDSIKKATKDEMTKIKKDYQSFLKNVMDEIQRNYSGKLLNTEDVILFINSKKDIVDGEYNKRAKKLQNSSH